MRRLRLTAVLATTLAVGFSLLLGTAGPAGAVTAAERSAVLASWTQTSAASYEAWRAADEKPSAWAAYGFDWSTDYCSVSPDKPLGFNFMSPCARHDFGYRNYRAAGQFSANKSRVDSAFHADLLRVCHAYAAVVRPACDALAATYFEAVHLFGSLVVSDTDVARAATLLPAGTSATTTSAVPGPGSFGDIRGFLSNAVHLAL